MRDAASDKESGRAKEDRSRSSYQGRRWEKPWRMFAERLERKERKAGVEIDCDAVSDWDVEIGSVGAEAISIFERGKKLDALEFNVQ